MGQQRQNLDLQTNLPLTGRLKYVDDYHGEHGSRTKLVVTIEGAHATEAYPAGEWLVWLPGWAMDALLEQGATTENKADEKGRRQFKVQNRAEIQILRREERDGDSNQMIKRINIILVAGGKPPPEPAQGAARTEPTTDERPPGPAERHDNTQPTGRPHPARAAHDEATKAKARQRGIFKAWLQLGDAYRVCFEMARYHQACASGTPPDLLDGRTIQAATASMLIQAEKTNLITTVGQFPGLSGTMRDYLEQRDPLPKPAPDSGIDWELAKRLLAEHEAQDPAERERRETELDRAYCVGDQEPASIAEPTPAGAAGAGGDDDLPF